MSKRVVYFYDDEVGNFNYGRCHPMKPHRIRMTHSLVLGYDIYKKLTIHRPPKANKEDLTKFHTDKYVNFLRRISPENITIFSKKMQLFNVGDDSPVFPGLYNFCQLSAGGSIGGAIKINKGEADIAINWAGGLHHAKKNEASGFCYINDIVLAILELLKYHSRVLYIDIDVHHGDGVEEAFYTTDRVMTVSFHKYGEFFPGTGTIEDIGYGKGKKYSVNFPLRDGIDDKTYEEVFKTIIEAVFASYRPSVIVLQSGADSLAGDRLGCFNLSEKGHSSCLKYLKTLGVPILLLGGGGYSIKNVSRCWAYETAIAANVEITSELPFTDYHEYYSPTFSLEVPTNNMVNLNTENYLKKCKEILFENIKSIGFSPSIQPTEIPDHFYSASEEEENEKMFEEFNKNSQEKEIRQTEEEDDLREMGV